MCDSVGRSVVLGMLINWLSIYLHALAGTGQSSSVPLLKHILQPGKCEVCDDALTRPGSKNK